MKALVAATLLLTLAAGAGDAPVSAANTAGGAAAATAGEYEVKAAYLYNFGKFVVWPADSLPAAQPLSICVVGKDPFGEVLDQTVRDKTVQEHKLVIRRLTSLDRVRECHILFVSAAEEHKLPQILRITGASNVLTVGETEGFVRKGGAITLVARDRKVRFDVNLRAAHDAGLEMSSQLLKVAANVIETEEHPE